MVEPQQQHCVAARSIHARTLSSSWNTPSHFCLALRLVYFQYLRRRIWPYFKMCKVLLTWLCWFQKPAGTFVDHNLPGGRAESGGRSASATSRHHLDTWAEARQKLFFLAKLKITDNTDKPRKEQQVKAFEHMATHDLHLTRLHFFNQDAAKSAEEYIGE